MNVLGANPDIIGTETVTDDRLDLTVTINGSRNRVTTRIMARATERNSHRMVMESKLGYKKAGQELRPHTCSGSSTIFSWLSAFLLVLICLLRERVVNCFCVGL